VFLLLCPAHCDTVSLSENLISSIVTRVFSRDYFGGPQLPPFPESSTRSACSQYISGMLVKGPLIFINWQRGAHRSLRYANRLVALPAPNVLQISSQRRSLFRWAFWQHDGSDCTVFVCSSNPTAPCSTNTVTPGTARHSRIPYRNNRLKKRGIPDAPWLPTFAPRDWMTDCLTTVHVQFCRPLLHPVKRPGGSGYQPANAPSLPT